MGSKETIVSFCMEFGLLLDEKNGIATPHAGGLGVLAGDKFYGAARLGLDYKVLTFLYPQGYMDFDSDGKGTPLTKPLPQHPGFLDELGDNVDKRETTYVVK
ncbi:MAG: hypothetical protein HYU02_04965 [Thaumarchaeota archaeon]|nr:hypothetical protein [Nitrososphaerota archaeon]